MKALSEAELKNLSEMKKSGVVSCYRTIRVYFGTRYVKIFSVDDLLASKTYPSYWYRDSGITETKALASGARLLTGWCL